MKKMKMFLVSSFVLFTFLGCNTPSQKNAEIKIGVLTPLSGENATYGKATQRGLEIALEELKPSEEFKDLNLELVYEDTQLEANLAVTGIQKLTSVNKVPVIIGPFGSSEVKAVSPIATSSRTPIISASATDDAIANLGDYVFRTVPTNKEQGTSMADFVFNKLNIKDNIIILSLNNDYGISLSESFRNKMKEFGANIIYEDKFEPSAKDFRTLISKVKPLNPKFIYIPDHYNEAGLLLKQLRESGLQVSTGGGDGSYSPQLTEIAGGGAENFYLTLMGMDISNPTTKTFTEKYKLKYGTEVDVYSAYAYDTMMLIAQVIKELKNENKELTSENIKNKLYLINYSGITGNNKFNADGEVNKSFVLYKVVNAQFQPIEK